MWPSLDPLAQVCGKCYDPIVYLNVYLLHTLCAHCIFSYTHNVKYQPICHTLYFTLNRACILNNVVLTTVIEMVEILDGRVRMAFN